MTRSIIVFGSINMDLVARVPYLPKPGETLIGYSFSTVSGGKGANQAVGAAKLGGLTRMIGRVGGDAFGEELLKSLQDSGVQTDFVTVDRSISSGVAMIAVDDRSENHIIVIPGANGNVDESDLEKLRSTLTDSSILLLQLEIPSEIVESAAAIAHQIGATVILDPAPAPTNFPDSLYPLIDILTPNAIETAQLVGFPIQSHTVDRAATVLQQRGTNTIVIKLGSEGAFCATQEERFWIPAFPVHAIDTVAAGDAFNAGMAVALLEGLPIREAVNWGAAAGALSTTKSGAQTSLVDRSTFDQFLKQKP